MPWDPSRGDIGTFLHEFVDRVKYLGKYLFMDISTVDRSAVRRLFCAQRESEWVVGLVGWVGLWGSFWGRLGDWATRRPTQTQTERERWWRGRERQLLLTVLSHTFVSLSLSPCFYLSIYLSIYLYFHLYLYLYPCIQVSDAVCVSVSRC